MSQLIARQRPELRGKGPTSQAPTVFYCVYDLCSRTLWGRGEHSTLASFPTQDSGRRCSTVQRVHFKGVGANQHLGIPMAQRLVCKNPCQCKAHDTQLSLEHRFADWYKIPVLISGSKNQFGAEISPSPRRLNPILITSCAQVLMNLHTKYPQHIGLDCAISYCIL